MKVLVMGGINNKMTIDLVNQLNSKEISFIIGGNDKKESPSSEMPFYAIKNRYELTEVLVAHKIDCVIHLWGTAITTNSIKNSFHESEENIERTINLLEACVEAKVKKIIFPSTISVYGEETGELLTEDSPLQPVLFEGLSKKMEEQYIKNYHALYGLSYSILRFSNVYGDQTQTTKEDIITSTIKQVLNGKPPIVFEDGEQKKDFLHITDAVHAIVSSIEKGGNEVINICSRNSVSLKEVVRFIEAFVKGKETALPLKREKIYISTEKAEMQLKWTPAVSLENEMIKMIKMISDNKNNYRYEEV